VGVSAAAAPPAGATYRPPKLSTHFEKRFENAKENLVTKENANI
jgi:hypothetical protein